MFHKVLFSVLSCLSSTAFRLVISSENNIQFHRCTDTQLYLSTTPTSALPPTSLSDCLCKNRSWFHSSFLKLNREKQKIFSLAPNPPMQKAATFLFLSTAPQFPLPQLESGCHCRQMILYFNAISVTSLTSVHPSHPTVLLFWFTFWSHPA